MNVEDTMSKAAIRACTDLTPWVYSIETYLINPAAIGGGRFLIKAPKSRACVTIMASENC